MGKCSDLCLSRWEGKDEKEVGRCQETGVIHVKVDPKYFRPTEVVSQISPCLYVYVWVVYFSLNHVLV